MKIFLTAILFISFSFTSLAQDDSEKLPPFEMLPQKAGEKKEIYELPHETIYQVYDIKGTQLLDSIAEFIDLTMLPKGTYFISYDGKKVKYNKETSPPKNLTTAPKCK